MWQLQLAIRYFGGFWNWMPLFLISSLKHTHTLTKICIYICTHAHRETNTEWLSSAFFLLNQFSKLQYCSLALFNIPKATFPTLLISVLGYGAFDKAGPSTLPSAGHPVLKAFLQVRRSALPLITRQLGIQHSRCSLVLGDTQRPFSRWSLGAKEGNQHLETEVLQAQTAVRWCQECCGVTTLAHALRSDFVCPMLWTDRSCSNSAGEYWASWANMAALPNSVLPLTLSLVLPEEALLIFSLPSRGQLESSEESEVNVAVFWASVRYLTLGPWFSSSEVAFFA